MENVFIKGSAGGKARAKIQKEESLKIYYDNPNKCLNCGNVIEVKNKQRVAEVRIKKFCNSSCSAIFNNKKFPRKTWLKEKNMFCVLCGKTIKLNRGKSGKFKRRKYCKPCFDKRFDYVGNVTKGELRRKYKNYTIYRNYISKNARLVYRKSGRQNSCNICGYEKFCTVCHKKGVSDFGKESKLSEINDINNLVVLCPNHHMELDRGILSL